MIQSKKNNEHEKYALQQSEKAATKHACDSKNSQCSKIKFYPKQCGVST